MAAASAAIFYSGIYIGNNSGSSGTVTVDGPGSTWTSRAATTLSSATPAAESSRSPTAARRQQAHLARYIGYNSGSSGTVTVEAPARRGPTAAASTSATPAAERYVANGGTVSSSSAAISAGGFQRGHGRGAGSTWTNNGSLYLGYYGDRNPEYHQRRHRHQRLIIASSLRRLLFRLVGHGNGRRPRLDVDQQRRPLRRLLRRQRNAEDHQRRRQQQHHAIRMTPTSVSTAARRARSPSTAPARRGPTAATSTSAMAAAAEP